MEVEQISVSPIGRQTVVIDGEYYYANLHELESCFLEVFSRYRCMRSGHGLTVEIDVRFLASRARLEMSRFIGTIAKKNLTAPSKQVEIEWKYECDDDDMEELGQIFKNIFIERGLANMFKLIPVF